MRVQPCSTLGSLAYIFCAWVRQDLIVTHIPGPSLVCAQSYTLLATLLAPMYCISALSCNAIYLVGMHEDAPSIRAASLKSAPFDERRGVEQTAGNWFGSAFHFFASTTMFALAFNKRFLSARLVKPNVYACSGLEIFPVLLR